MPGVHAHHGRAVQVDPIKPKLNAPETKRLQLICNDLVADFAFKFKLRRYTMALGVILTRAGLSLDTAAMWRLRGPVAGACTRPLFR